MLIHCFTLYCNSFILFMGVCETCMLFSLWCEKIYIFKKQNQRKSVINKVGERISPEGMFGSICNKRLWVGKYEKWNVVCAYNQHQCIYKIITFGIFAIFLRGGGYIFKQGIRILLRCIFAWSDFFCGKGKPFIKICGLGSKSRCCWFKKYVWCGDKKYVCIHIHSTLPDTLLRPTIFWKYMLKIVVGWSPLICMSSEDV